MIDHRTGTSRTYDDRVSYCQMNSMMICHGTAGVLSVMINLHTFNYILAWVLCDVTPNLGALNLKMTNFKLPQIGSLDDFDCLRIFWER